MSVNKKSKSSYNYIESEPLDTYTSSQRIANPKLQPFPEKAFNQGIRFNVKLIGQLEINRPNSRSEIVACMRRVRSEFKDKKIKKRKVILEVSLDGLKTLVSLKNTRNSNPVEITLFHNPIYRIFYVSHDSRDTKIFSYIARQSSSFGFICIVFKSESRTQAMKIVRSVGQAFEVSHKNIAPSSGGSPSEGQIAPIGQNLENNQQNIQPEVPEKVVEKPKKHEKTSLTDDLLPPKLKKDIMALGLRLGQGLTRGGTKKSSTGDSAKQTEDSQSSLPPPAASPTCKTFPDRGFESQSSAPPSQSNGSNVNKDKDKEVKSTAASCGEPDVNKDSIKKDKRKLKKSYSVDEREVIVDDNFDQDQESEESDSDNEGCGGSDDEISEENLSKEPFQSTYEIHCNKLLQEQLEQQTQCSQHALAQVALLRDQLAAESQARIEAQTRTQQLLIHNKALIEHLQSLVKHIQQLELSLKKNKKSSDQKQQPSEEESEEDDDDEDHEEISSTANPLPKVSKSPKKSSQKHPQHQQLYHHQSPSPSHKTLNLNSMHYIDIYEALRLKNAQFLERYFYENTLYNYMPIKPPADDPYHLYFDPNKSPTPVKPSRRSTPSTPLSTPNIINPESPSSILKPTKSSHSTHSPAGIYNRGISTTSSTASTSSKSKNHQGQSSNLNTPSTSGQFQFPHVISRSVSEKVKNDPTKEVIKLEAKKSWNRKTK